MLPSTSIAVEYVARDSLEFTLILAMQILRPKILFYRSNVWRSNFPQKPRSENNMLTAHVRERVWKIQDLHAHMRWNFRKGS
jgi:hypothetical protein